MKEIYLESLHTFISKVVPHPESDWILFRDSLIFKEIEKGSLLTRAGETENYMYFLVDGVIRIFQERNNIEYTLRFNFPISPFNSYASFISRSPSLINVEALTDIKVFRMSYDKMQILYENSRMAERIGRRMIEILYVQREFKELNMNSKTAEDYYFELLKTNKKLTEQIPQKYLASYLGIAPESLSRIRRKLSV